LKLFLTRSSASIRSTWPTAKPTRRPASERDLDSVCTTSRLGYFAVSGIARPAEIDIGLVDHHHRIRVGLQQLLDRGQRTRRPVGAFGLGKMMPPLGLA
jgi:hypothetical protein